MTKRRDGEEQPPEAARDDAAEPTASGQDAHGLEALEGGPVPPATREDIERLRKEVDGLRDELLRRRADFENYKKRMERDRQQAGQDAVAGVFKALIPTLDNLERALAAEGGEATLREGVELTHRELLGLLASRGVSIQDPLGEKFDPAVHQALAHEFAPGFEEGTVFEVLRKGYLFHGRLLRPALVKVAKGGVESEGEAVH